MDLLSILDFTLSVLIGLIILVMLVALHEFGHGIVARRNGVKVEEFGIGFPPRAKGWKVKKSVLGDNVLYSLNWLPLGGFVKLKGEHDSANKQGDYGAASLWAKTKILLAGVVVNWLTAAVLLSVVAVAGIPKMIDNQFMVPGDTKVNTQPVTVGAVIKGLPAESAGIKTGDQIFRLAGVDIEEATQLTKTAEQHKGQTVEVLYKRGDEEKTADIKLRAVNEDKKGYIGLAAGQRTTYQSTWSAPIVGLALTGQYTWHTLSSLGETLANFVVGLVQKISFSGQVREAGDAKLAEVGANVGGPVAILGMIFPAAREDGLVSLLLVSALVSLALAVMNALPIPALDGGRWFVTILYRVILKKSLTKEKEEKIHGTGMIVLLGLFLLVTVSDVFKLGG